MKLIGRYIVKTVLSSIFMVTFMLAGLQIFILFVNQLGELGKGDYEITQAAWYVMSQLPYQVYLFFPMASLLGCLIGLGGMANHRELVVMRASGMSIWQVTLAVLKAAFVLIVIVTLLGETLIPQLARIANDHKMLALTKGQTLRTSKGLWLRYQNDFITIGTVETSSSLLQVFQFRFDASHHLILARRMQHVYFTNGAWKAVGVYETTFQNNMTKARKLTVMNWGVPFKPKLFGMGDTEPDEMTLHELRQFIRAQKATNQFALNYRLDYWQRIFQPLTTLVMMMLAIPFIFGPLRASTMGSKLLVGVMVGFGFYILNRFFGPLSLVLQWPPLVAAIGPTCIFALLGGYLIRRAR
jgi:lipopolysaccharide export system permease protein